MKSVGWQLPAQHQTMSGAEPLFHAMVSAMTRADSVARVRSALIWWNRCEGDLAPA